MADHDRLDLLVANALAWPGSRGSSQDWRPPLRATQGRKVLISSSIATDSMHGLAAFFSVEHAHAGVLTIAD